MKHRTQHLAIVGLVVVAAIYVAATVSEKPPSGWRRDGHMDAPGIYGPTESERQAIERDMELMAAGGFQLPKLRIYVHDSVEGCGGYRGRYRQKGDVNRIDLCEVTAALEELIHAWEYHNMSDTTRAAYMAMEDIGRWNHADDGHQVRGVEKVAKAIMWGLRGPLIQAFQLNTFISEIETYYLVTEKLPPRLDDAAADKALAALAQAAAVSQ